nr:MAG TPA: hypothetical protein [Caudoviricetes sp.]
MRQEGTGRRLFIFCGGFGANLLHNMRIISPSGVLVPPLAVVRAAGLGIP